MPKLAKVRKAIEAYSVGLSRLQALTSNSRNTFSTSPDLPIQSGDHLLGAAPDTSSLYTALPLDACKREVRLAVLHAGSAASSDISITLSVVNLDSEPAYDALSYAWGTHEGPKHVTINGHSFAVTQNLFAALLALRSTIPSPSSVSADTLDDAAASESHGDRILWIDAICIDQSSISERNAQVRLMGDVYRCATQVLMWVGEQDADSDTALDLIRHFQADDPRHRTDRDIWYAYTPISSRPYFQRTWVVQEMILAKGEPVIVCGAKSIDWESFMAPLRRLLPKDSDIISIALRAARGGDPIFRLEFLDYLRSDFKKHGRVDVVSMLVTSALFDASEPRDKIYGFIQLLDPAQRGGIKVDYELSIGRVFGSALALVFEQGLGPLVIGCMTCPAISTSLAPNLPSWMPDMLSGELGRYSNRDFAPPMPWSASGSRHSETNGKVMSDSRTLLVNTVYVDSVELVVHFGGTADECIAKLGLVDRLAREARSKHIVDGSLRPYFEKFRTSEPLWRTLVLNQTVRDGGLPPESCREIYGQLLASGSRPSWKNNPATTNSEYCLNLCMRLPRSSFFVTKSGLVGIGTPGVRRNDDLSIWFGARSPYFTRPQKLDAGKHRLTGAAYVAGIMRGEMVDEVYNAGIVEHRTLMVV